MKTSQPHKSLPEKNKAASSENEQLQLNNDVVVPTVSQETSQPVTPNGKQTLESQDDGVEHKNTPEEPEIQQETDLIVANKASTVSSEAPTAVEEQSQPVDVQSGDGEGQQVVAELESVQLRISEGNETETSTSVVVDAASREEKLDAVETITSAVSEQTNGAEAAVSVPESTPPSNNEERDTHEPEAFVPTGVQIDEVIQSQSETVLESSQESRAAAPVEDVQIEKVEEQLHAEIPDDQVTSVSPVDAILPAAEEQAPSSEQTPPSVEPISDEITAVVQETVETVPTPEPDFGVVAAPAVETQAEEKVEEQPSDEVSNGDAPSASSVEPSIPAAVVQSAPSEPASSNVEPFSDEVTAVVQEVVETTTEVEPAFDATSVVAEETQPASVEKVDEQPATESDSTHVPVVSTSEEQVIDGPAAVLPEEPASSSSVEVASDDVHQQTVESSLPVADEQSAPSEQNETSTVVSDTDATLQATASDVVPDPSAVPEVSASVEVILEESTDVVQKPEEPADNVTARTEEDGQQQSVEPILPRVDEQIATSEQETPAIETLPEAIESDAVADSAPVVVTNEEQQTTDETAAHEEPKTPPTLDADSEQKATDHQIAGIDDSVGHQDETSVEAVGHSEVTPVAIQEAVVETGEHQQTPIQSADETKESVVFGDGQPVVEQSTPETETTSAAEIIPIVVADVISDNSEPQSSVERIAQEEDHQDSEIATVSDHSLSSQLLSGAEGSSVETQPQTLSDDALPQNQSAAAEHPSITITDQDQEQSTASTPIDLPAPDTTPVSSEP